MHLYHDLKTPPLISITEEHSVVFLHIAKTAGTTFNDVLYRHFSNKKRCPWNFMEQPFVDFSPYRFFTGHFYYSVISQLVPTKPVFLSFFRNPVERSISHYYQLVRIYEEQPHLLERFPEDLESFVNSYEYNVQIANHQTYTLTADINFANHEELQTAWTNFFVQVREGFSLPAEAAYPIIDSLDFFGLTEDFNTSIALLSHTFGWEPIQTVDSKNVGSYPKPAKHVIDKIIELNQEDLKLYDYAKRVFDERVAQMRRDQQRLYYLVNRASTTPRNHRVHHVFDHINGEGWYVPENRPDGTDFMWTGPGTRSTLDLALAHGQDLILRGHVLAALRDEILFGLEVTINGHPIALTYHPAKQGGGFEFEGIIPSAVIPRNRYFSTLVFSVPETIPPRELDPQNPDTRPLGVALSWLDISPTSDGPTAVLADAYLAEISVNLLDSAWSPSATYTLQVRFQNTGESFWSSSDRPDGTPAVKLGTYWVDSAGMVLPGSTSYSPLPHDLPPGSASYLSLNVSTPPVPGGYTLCVNLLQSPNAWLDRWFTSAPAQLTVRVS